MIRVPRLVSTIALSAALSIAAAGCHKKVPAAAPARVCGDARQADRRARFAGVAREHWLDRRCGRHDRRHDYRSHDRGGDRGWIFDHRGRARPGFLLAVAEGSAGGVAVASEHER